MTASSISLPADSSTLTSSTSPFSVTTKETMTETDCPDLRFGAFFGYEADEPETLLASTSTSAVRVLVDAVRVDGVRLGRRRRRLARP